MKKGAFLFSVVVMTAALLIGGEDAAVQNPETGAAPQLQTDNGKDAAVQNPETGAAPQLQTDSGEDAAKRVAERAARAAEREAELRETGGRIDQIPKGPEFVMADAREAPVDNAPGRVAETIRNMFKIAATNVAVAATEAASPAEAATRLRKSRKALLAVMVVGGDKTAPALVVYPEERVAVVNADAAARFAAGADAEKRVIKECWRALGFLCGAGYSANDASVMQPIGSPLELDAVEWQVISPMQFQQMNRFLKKYGARRGRRTTYRKAVEEGWAPAPTNDYQRAIWEEVRSATNAANAKAKGAE